MTLRKEQKEIKEVYDAFWVDTNVLDFLPQESDEYEDNTDSDAQDAESDFEADTTEPGRKSDLDNIDVENANVEMTDAKNSSDNQTADANVEMIDATNASNDQTENTDTVMNEASENESEDERKSNKFAPPPMAMTLRFE